MELVSAPNTICNVLLNQYSVSSFKFGFENYFKFFIILKKAVKKLSACAQNFKKEAYVQ